MLLYRLPPIDEAAQDEALSRFIEELRTAVARKDTEFVLNNLSPDFSSGFGPDSGAESFAAQLREPKGEIWKEFGTALSLGGAFVDDDSSPAYCAPYVYAAFPVTVDPMSYQVVIRESVAARSEPSPSSEKVAEFSYHVIPAPVTARQLKDSQGGRWAPVRLDKRTVYVPADSIRSPLDYRACFARHEGRWTLTSFSAGD